MPVPSSMSAIHCPGPDWTLCTEDRQLNRETLYMWATLKGVTVKEGHHGGGSLTEEERECQYYFHVRKQLGTLGHCLDQKVVKMGTSEHTQAIEENLTEASCPGNPS